MILFIVLVGYAHISHSDTDFIDVLSDEALMTNMHPSTTNMLHAIKEIDNTPVTHKESNILAKVVTDRLEVILSRQKNKSMSIQEQVQLIEDNLIQTQPNKQKSTPFALIDTTDSHTTNNQPISTPDTNAVSNQAPIEKYSIDEVTINKPTPIASSLSLTKDKMRQNGFTLDSLANEFAASITPP